MLAWSRLFAIVTCATAFPKAHGWGPEMSQAVGFGIRIRMDQANMM